MKAHRKENRSRGNEKRDEESLYLIKRPFAMVRICAMTKSTMLNPMDTFNLPETHPPRSSGRAGPTWRSGPFAMALLCAITKSTMLNDMDAFDLPETHPPSSAGRAGPNWRST